MRILASCLLLSLLAVGADSVPSPASCVRACPLGAASPKRYWNGISPKVKEWELGKRAEALAWMEQHKFGTVPANLAKDEKVGTASVELPACGATINVVCTMPSGADAAHPVPVFLIGGDFHGKKSPGAPRDQQDAIPVNSLVARGYACVRWNFNDVEPIMRTSGKNAVGVRAWGYSRIMDWIESRPELDARRVAVAGHGRDGMTALWTGAQDERFAMVVSGGSDIAGSRTQHRGGDLLSLVAPRLLYVVGGASGAGESSFKAAMDAARDLYRAYRLDERAGHHVSSGSSGLDYGDWERAMDFADRRLKAPYPADSDAIDRRISAACADGCRTMTLTRNAASPDGAWRITRAILLPDDFTLVLDGCRVELVDGVQDNIIRNAGAAPGSTVPNRGIRVLGRNGAVLCGGHRNHYLPRRSGDPNGWRAVGILLCDVSDYEIGGFAMEETQCWAISQERCFRGHLHDIVFGSTDIMFNQDGIDLRKGCHDILIENISGTTGDDTVALTAYRDPPGTAPRYDMQIGGNADMGERDDVFNVTIRNVRSRSVGGHGIIRLLVCDGICMHHVTVDGVVDTARGKDKRSHATIRIGDSRFYRTRRCALGEMHDIHVRDVRTAGPVAVGVYGALSDSEIVGIAVEGGGRRHNVTAPCERVKFD